jgi:hypothetical protein
MPLKVYGDGHPLIRSLHPLPGITVNRMVASVKTVLTCTMLLIGYGTMAYVLALYAMSVKECTFFIIFS